MSKFPEVGELRIVYYPDPRLKEVARQVDHPQSFHIELAERMGELMAEAAGVGLAANQVGLLDRIVVINVSGGAGKTEAFINPKIISSDGDAVEQEGCLSVPGIRSKVRRAESVRVSATLLDGETVEIEAKGLLARVWQHEIDHLNGVLFVSRLGTGSKILISRRLRKLEEAWRKDSGLVD